MSSDPQLIYGLEVRIIDLENKVADLAKTVARDQTRDDRSNLYSVPDAVREQIAAGENAVRVLRMLRLLTQRELGERTGLTENHISAIERGREYGLKTARLIATALNAPEDLFLRVRVKNKKKSRSES